MDVVEMLVCPMIVVRSSSLAPVSASAVDSQCLALYMSTSGSPALSSAVCHRSDSTSLSIGRP